MSVSQLNRHMYDEFTLSEKIYNIPQLIKKDLSYKSRIINKNQGYFIHSKIHVLTFS